jgi:signal transduction histidine kinase/CheY-like chemotaxis protein
MYRRALIAHFKGETQRFECEYRYRMPNGSWHWARHHGIAERRADGRARRMVGATGDITEAKQREHELRTAQAEAAEARGDAEHTREALQTVIDNMRDCVVLFNKDLRVKFINDQAIEFQRYPPDVAHASLHDIVRFLAERGDFGPPDEAERLVEERLALLLGGTRHERRTASGRYVQFDIKPLDGGGLLIVSRDITELKEREEALAAAKGAAEAARDAAERAHSEVERTREKLEIANKYKSHFLASASHDLRQPLHALNLFVGQLRDESNPAERSRLVSRIDAAVGSMNELFEALLDMTKLEAGILKPNPTAIPVERVLDRIETTFADAARKKGLQLRVVASEAWVSSDPILLERIMLNLVSNAVRYTERGGVVVGCRHRGPELRIDICDTGGGIPADERQRIFGEFYQLSGLAPDRSGGFGLGLAIVDRLGRLLGHRVELESSPGRCSRFSVSVPLTAQPRTAELPAPLPAIADPARGKRVIVIDDDALVLDGMRGILQSWGCQVQTAASGDAALAGLAKDGGSPDLIISDSRLADGESGVETIERLRAAMGAPIPAFVITGDTAPERLREARAGGFLLLHKPVSPMALRTTLNRLLKAHDTRVASSNSSVA